MNALIALADRVGIVLSILFVTAFPVMA